MFQLWSHHQERSVHWESCKIWTSWYLSNRLMLGVLFLFLVQVGWTLFQSKFIRSYIPKGWKSSTWKSFLNNRNYSTRLVLENRILFTIKYSDDSSKVSSLCPQESNGIWSFQGPWVHTNSTFRKVSTQTCHLHLSNSFQNLL